MTLKLLAGLLAVSLAFAGCRSGSLYAPSKDSTSGSTPAVNCAGAMMVSSNRGQDLEAVLQCETFFQRVYWLGKQLAPPNVSPLFFTSVWTAPDERPIGPDTRLVLGYSSDPSRPLARLYLTERERAAWHGFISQFKGYDPYAVRDPTNWWQHPCVEKQVYRAANGAEVHLFKAHLVSLIYIYPKTAEEVAQCLKEPVGAFGAHVYFERTVIEFSVQHDVSPGGPPPGPGPVPAGASPDPVSTPRTYATLVLHSENPYNREDVVRFISGSLKPYDGK